jgi:hypothetical protein
MPTYVALVYAAEADAPAPDSPAASQLYQAGNAFTVAVWQAGFWRGGDELLPTSTATTVRVRDGVTSCSAGPFAPTAEQLGRFYLFECATPDEAIAWAAKIPEAARGSVELRPVVQL